jgi:hypothetical protein
MNHWVRESCWISVDLSCCSEKLRPGTVREPRGTGTSAVGRRYQATALKKWLLTLVCVIVNCEVKSRVV